MNSLQRRPLSLSRLEVHSDAAHGLVVVEGEPVSFKPLTAEHFEALLVYLSPEVARAREFLLEGSTGWTGGGQCLIPVYRIGWSDGPKLTVNGAKACVAALRLYYPLRDREDEAESSGFEPVAEGQKVVSIQQNAMFEMKHWNERRNQ
ncbi:hypothetical protein [Stenotrophobium rhamnosiphilum]|uniref:Uncharacterized protein n=1 Tax=Stenotrophobium rhamnosiphilum TaxID=2029166 RepID=A0A2T5MEJ1_9GAMM|nr:hypothetical protein [Stenotrophobium rhamnosiphilum]PTU30959.1 hypothetical protein CJD38_11675 [Stenotrophobium rhamnosiphilum]